MSARVVPAPEDCPERQYHGNPFRYCGSCSWIEPSEASTAVTYSGALAGSDGSSLAITGAVLTPAPVTPTPDPTPTPSTGRVRAVWHHGWSGPSLSSWPVDVRSSVTCITLAMSQSAAKGTGKLTLPPGVTKAEVLTLVKAGVDVLVGVGGSGDGGIVVTGRARLGLAEGEDIDGGITLKTSAHVDELVTSVLANAATLGTTGICWDLEGAPGSGWTATAVADASQRLVAAGQQVAIWSALYGGRLAAWGSVAAALGANLHHWERGFYDFQEANDSRLTGIVTSDLASMRQAVARDDQLVASFAPVGSTSRTATSTMTAAYAAARAKMPDVGFSVWEDFQDAKIGWASTRGLAAVA